jgi:hypothetical protein
LRDDVFELGLLPACCLLIAPDLSGSRRIGAAAVDACELRLEPRTNRIDPWRNALRQGIGGRAHNADGASQYSYRAGKGKVRHDPPSERSRSDSANLLYEEELSSAQRAHRDDLFRNQRA